MVVTSELSLPVLVMTHGLSLYFLSPVLLGMVLVGTWCPARVNSQQYLTQSFLLGISDHIFPSGMDDWLFSF